MSKSNKKNYLIAGIAAAFLSFILLFIGIKVVLGNDIVTRNIMAFMGFSTLVGIIISVSVLFGFRIVYSSFAVGLAVGFLLMYRAFFQDMSGWSDLIGLISMFAFALIGLGAGVLGQLGYKLFRKYRL